MQEINELIIEKLNKYTESTRKLAISALELAEKGLSEASIAEQLSSVVRQITKKTDEKNDTA